MGLVVFSVVLFGLVMVMVIVVLVCRFSIWVCVLVMLLKVWVKFL